ncbi:MAG: hypothetical protein RL088_1907 [Verrucomicrobiota bacterium]|jgi:hypothetical protein
MGPNPRSTEILVTTVYVALIMWLYLLGFRTLPILMIGYSLVCIISDLRRRSPRKALLIIIALIVAYMVHEFVGDPKPTRKVNNSIQNPSQTIRDVEETKNNKTSLSETIEQPLKSE